MCMCKYISMSIYINTCMHIYTCILYAGMPLSKTFKREKIHT